MINISYKQQSGTVLVVSLIMLMMLTLIGVSGLHTTALEEKMSGNLKDQNVAFQAAESALRDAEKDIYTSGRVSGLTGMDANCTNGLCYAGVDGIHEVWNESTKVANAISYGAKTSVSAIQSVNAQPKYLIVGMKTQVPGSASRWKYMYKITAIGYGAQSNTKVILTELFAP